MKSKTLRYLESIIGQNVTAVYMPVNVPERSTIGRYLG